MLSVETGAIAGCRSIRRTRQPGNRQRRRLRNRNHLISRSRRTGRLADLTVVGPETPLVDGVVDEFRAKGKLIVGPDRAAARLEGSKIFAKRFFAQSGIPTAGFATADNETEARAALDRFGFPVVLKADGLAAGKGVIIAQDRAEAEAAISQLKSRLVIEEFLRGEEV